MFNTLTGRFLILTIIFVMLAEILIFVPSVAAFRRDYLLSRLERAQIASLALLADEMIAAELETELLRNAEVLNVVLRRDEVRQLMLSSPIPAPIERTFDMRDPGGIELLGDALRRLFDPEPRVIRVIGAPVREAGLLIEVTMETQGLRAAMIDFGGRILVLSAMISAITAFFLFLAVRAMIVRPIKRVVGAIASYADAPEDARRIIQPSAGVVELREAEEALQTLQTELTLSLKQKDRLAQLGSAVAKISHDLRNILTSSQLFADRLESSTDPLVVRLVPKLLNSLSRAVTLCESTLAFGRAEEPAPQLMFMSLAGIAEEVVEGERLAVQEYDISFSADVPNRMMVRADPEQLFRVISNLVRNARQAIISSGKAGEISISAQETQYDWKICVADTGPGLPPKAQEHLFTPFQGGVRSGGSGLGLAISSELVRGHGGTLTLKSTGPKGTEFEITLPKGELQIE